MDLGKTIPERLHSALYWTKDDGGGGNKGSYKTYQTVLSPVKWSPPTNQHPAFYRSDALPVAQPTASNHWRESTYQTLLSEISIQVLTMRLEKQNFT